MADFQEQVMGLTGLTIDNSSTTPSRAEFSTFLNDGVLDVTRRSIGRSPNSAVQFIRESDEQTTNASLDLNGAQIISVVRESGVNNQWEGCRYIPPAMQYSVTDTSSLNYASKYNPVYTILDDGKISVFPVPGSNPESFKVYYVNDSPEEADGTALDHASTGIKYFPKDKIYLVIIYAAIKSLECKMAEYTIEEEDIELVQAITQNLASLKQQYEGALSAPVTGQEGGNR